MKRKDREKLPLIIILLLAFGFISPISANNQKLDNWYMRSSEGLNKEGPFLSSSFQVDRTWLKVKIPTTVLGALCNAGIYKNIFYGKNLKKVPTEQFKKHWWFCTRFNLPKFNSQKEISGIFFDGINYRANVWLNGIQILSADTTFGAYRIHSCDISSIAREQNNLAVEVFPPKAGDFYMGFVDWAPSPPDHNIGIFRPVYIKRCGKISIENPFVSAQVNTQTLKEAALTISTNLTNNDEESHRLVLEATFGRTTIKENFLANPKQTIKVILDSNKFEELLVKNPRLWWPNGLGKPEMYTLHLKVSYNNQASDSTSVRFGIRDIETYLDSRNVRGYKINGRKLLIKGAGMCDDLLLRNDSARYIAEIRYVKEMNLNALRFEGIWGTSQKLYDLCDENGILLMVGWSCQWEWPDYLGLDMKVADEDQNIPINVGVDKYGFKLNLAQETYLADFFRDQVIWLRNHPSVFVWVVGSDAMPKPSLENRYLKILKEFDYNRSLLVSAGEFTSTISGPSGMKMNGPYDYVAPIYWYEDKKLGGAFGFNTETGPGPQIPPIQSIRRIIPEEYLWPTDNEMWSFHSGQKNFSTMQVYLNAMAKRYGSPKNLEDLAMKAQWTNYEAIRPMFEAFEINRPEATGVIQWQLNSPWAEFYWQLYDWFLMPNGAYFGTKKACRSKNIIYDYYGHSVYVSNDTLGDLKNYIASAILYDSNSKIVLEKKRILNVKENSCELLAELPPLINKKGLYFLYTTLQNEKGVQIADNFYWLSGTMDKMDWSKYFWCYTQIKDYADFNALSQIPHTQIGASITAFKKKHTLTFTLKNKTDKIAFCVQLTLLNGKTGEPILPVYWSDNYVSLIGNSSKEITVDYDTPCSNPQVLIEGTNIQPITLKP